MVFELPWAKKRTFWAFEKVNFQVFGNFGVTKLKPFFGRVRQSVQSYLNKNVVIGIFLENAFWATLSWKTNVLKVWKGHFSFSCKVLRDEAETVFWESEAKPSKVFKSKVFHNQILRKWFSSYLELKKRMFWRFEKGIFHFFWNFWVAKLKTFSVKIRQSVETYLN